MTLKSLKLPSPARMRSTQWLANRLGISVSTVEKLRSQGSTDIPPHITIGRRFLYDDIAVENWITKRLEISAQSHSQPGGRHAN